jgi:hypothetical protein
MENAKETRWAEPAAWITTLGNLLPFWLLSFVVMAEGFPRPPISGEVTIASFVTAIAASIALVWKRWLTAGFSSWPLPL